MNKTMSNNQENKLIEGCNYHTTWQNHPDMRFVLAKTIGDYSILYTRRTKKLFWCKNSDLIFIKTNCNINKANNLLKQIQ